jgi:hypothetical protein
MSTAIRNRSLLLATIRIHQTEILSLACPRIDVQSGAQLVELVVGSVKRGARDVVLDFSPGTVIDFAGARAVQAASVSVGADGKLFLAGLNGRARTLLRAVRVAEHVHMVEWWTDAMESAPMSRAA